MASKMCVCMCVCVRERERKARRSGTFERALLFGPGSRDPKPLSADILSARKYNRPSEKLTGRGPVTRHFFNPRELLSFVRSLHFCSFVCIVSLSLAAAAAAAASRNGHPLRRICIYMYIHIAGSVSHAKRPPENFYSSHPGRALRPRDSLEWSDRNLSSAFSRSAFPLKKSG